MIFCIGDAWALGSVARAKERAISFIVDLTVVILVYAISIISAVLREVLEIENVQHFVCGVKNWRRFARNFQFIHKFVMLFYLSYLVLPDCQVTGGRKGGESTH